MTDMMMSKGAIFSPCEKYRYLLWRIWDQSKPLLMMVMMNPSTADAEANDPTVERCQRRASQNGYGGLVVLNSMAYRSTDPSVLDDMPSGERFGPDNADYLTRALDLAAAGAADVVCGWGEPGHRLAPYAWFSTQASRRKVTLWCLGKNRSGAPKHPLYVPYSKALEWLAGTNKWEAGEPVARAKT
ncbi:DUF1643 domain-containing protein [Ahrensia sp. R2A130]|uniref:DUF1643 domain-containing protein n=1 Tax=Ahrensia sp. R2A130 TaxID=744979 RepID=UPI0001E0BCCD|nr:DUF1643 domain-containing protein [Ahrensia sp. R2A130]EFL88341.1 conserved hypothetical protein [Ahrensia sp. R2A130]